MAQQPPPKAPQVQAAEIRAMADLKMAQMDTQAHTTSAQADHDLKMQELQMKLQLAQLDYANRHQISLDQLKTELATTTMKLQVQKQLSGADMAMDLHKHRTDTIMEYHKHTNPSPQVLTPPTEPVGQAAAGHAFEQ